MRITERFINPRFDEVQQISFALVQDVDPARIELHFSTRTSSRRRDG